MKFHIFVLFALIFLFGNLFSVSAQADSVIGQITSSPRESFVGGISGDGRFVVFESFGNLATENPRNADGNREIFLFDYAQRRIFQITNTRNLLIDPTKPASAENSKIVITNLRPVISNDGRWIAFGSNANSVLQPSPLVNPGNFDASSLSDAQGNNPLTQDANTELWLYQIPAVAPANLSSGAEVPFTNLNSGVFVRATDTPASFLPTPATSSSGPIVADDNREPSISDDGTYIAFVSTRDLVTGGNASPNANDEIFTFVRTANFISQVTRTTRGTVSAPTYNQNPSISGNGLRVAFLSNADNPVIGMTNGTNTDKNVEIFYTDLDLNGNPASATARQITKTTRVNPGDVLNIFDLGRRMSRDGRFIAFDSYADLANENGGANYTSFALYLYDATANSFRRIGPRSDADSAAAGGDVAHYPGFTDYDLSGTPQTLVLETRLNIKADGTVATTAADGLNPNEARPAQVYSYPLSVAPASATFTRLTNFPTPNLFLASTQPIPSNTVRRMSFTLALTEIGTGNRDLANEAFYFLLPLTASQNTSTLSFATGASAIPVSASPVPTPTASPSPTPQTPPAVQGVSPGMQAIVNFTTTQTITSQTAVGSITRRFTLPIELGGVTMTINGAACGLKSVSSSQIVFIVPPGLPVPSGGTITYPVVINNNGEVIKGTITVVSSRPDVFTTSSVPGPNGRARALNVTYRNATSEPFSVTSTLCPTCSRRSLTPTILRVFLTGVENVAKSAITVRIGSKTISGDAILSDPVLREPGVYSIDFKLPADLAAAGDVPVVVTVVINGVTYQSRLDDTAPRIQIL